ncbi:hypothetical protein L7F22_040027 [Adiantum nelumboides]|nr:hypothetical protein [Adiantum nelumboides]
MLIHALVAFSGHEADKFVQNSLVDMYAKCGEVDNAQCIFDELEERNLVSWNALISGFVQQGWIETAFELFEKMEKTNIEANDVTFLTAMRACASGGHLNYGMLIHSCIVQDFQVPDRVTFLNVLKACGNMCFLDQAQQLHRSAKNFGVEFDLSLNNTLIDMYGKCGDVDAARQIFNGMQEHDTVSWNTLMTGYAQHGHVSQTFECLHQMQVEQKLDHVTFVTTLSMCNYAGLVDEGFYHFNSLYSEHGISHTQEQCACMVDILCRAGRMLEAEKFIRKLPFSPGPVVWMAMLSGCRLGSSLFLAINAAKSIFEFQPQNTAPYVVLSNICALVGVWEGTTNLEYLVEVQDVNTWDENSCICIGDQNKEFSHYYTLCAIEGVKSNLRRLFLH